MTQPALMRAKAFIFEGMRWFLVGLILWAQEQQYDAYLPELPPAQLLRLEGAYVLRDVAPGSYRDSTIEAQSWTSRIAWSDEVEWYPPAPVQVSEPLVIQKRVYTYVLIYPWQLHRSGQKIRLYESPPSYSLSPKAFALRQSQQTWKSQSILATGTWYKVETGPAGVYRIDAALLEALGLDPSLVDPRNLRVYGQRGGLLPQANALPAPDDLEEIPLYFPGESDGRWDLADAAYFFAEGADSWYPHPTRRFFHLKNPSTDSCAFFITFDLGRGQRISTRPPAAGVPVPSQTVLSFYFYDPPLVNLVKSGRLWLGEQFDALQPSRSFSLPLPASDSLLLYIQVAAASLSPASFVFSWNGATLGSVSISAIPGPADSYQARARAFSTKLTNTPASPTLTLTYNGRSDSRGYLDYIEALVYHPLNWAPDQQLFAVPAGLSPTLIEAPGPQRLLWDVTNPLNPQLVPLTPTSNGYSFVSPNDTMHFYCAFDESKTYRPNPVGRVANQNLHSYQDIDYVVVTTEALAPLCSRFCELAPAGLACQVFSIEAIYNEFSGGRRDICALRNFLRMLYERSTRPPQYLLIVGQASYDLRYSGKTFVPTYQSRESFYPPETYSSDDFFGFLDPNEGTWGENNASRIYDPANPGLQNHGLDLAITRIPVYSQADLEIYLQKLTNYINNPSTIGPWYRQSVFFSDYKDNGLHTSQAEDIAEGLVANLPYTEPNKIYIDIYPAIPQASGLSFPQAKAALLNHLSQGGLFAHYVGHGNPYALQGFDFFPIPTVRQMANTNRYYFFITATCEWGKWDEPEVRSGGLEALFLPQRGAIGLLTSTRKVFASYNFALSKNFYQALYNLYGPQRSIYLGHLMQETKNRSWLNAGAINSRSFSFLGVPVLPLRLPDYTVTITSINGHPPNSTQPDTLRPLMPIEIEGVVQDSQGLLVNDFQGEVALRLWDKRLTRKTLISQTPYQNYDVLLFSGRASINQGRFRLKIYLPLEIIPTPGYGRLTIWAQSPDGRSGAGSETRFVVCCPDSIPPKTSPPQIRLYINDTNWVSGSWTNPNPTLIAYISDSLGINLSALAIGKELKAYLNEQEILLSNYYESLRDQPNRGQVIYRWTDLPPGTYHLRLEAWNLAGQKGTAETTFIVPEKGPLRIRRLFNYPNPFTTYTQFWVEHSQPGQLLEARLQIFTLTGRVVRTLNTTLTNSLDHSLSWDGLDEYGDRLGRGVYLYRLQLRNPITGETASAHEKLVLMR